MTDQTERIGYKRPPVHSRFKAGVSGNPNGRPKRCPTFRSVLQDELAAPIQVENEQAPISTLRALVKNLIAAAMSGNARAQSLLLGAIERLGETDENEPEALSAEDRELLDAHLREERGEDAACESKHQSSNELKSI
jgi:Family of unknown function (DUF5681)